MKLIAILICLGLERYFRLGTHLLRFTWVPNYVALMQNFVRSKYVWQSWLGVVVLHLPILLIVGLVYSLTTSFFYGVLSLTVSVLILIYCLGPGDLYQDFQNYTVAAENNEKDIEQQSLAAVLLKPTSTQDTNKLARELSNAIAVRGNEEILGVLFWFVVFGPLGAVFYRLSAELAILADRHKESGLAECRQQLNTLWNIVNWVPTRVTALLYALVGHFSHSFNIWLQYALQGLDSNYKLLEEVAFASMDFEEPTTNSHKVLTEGNRAIALIDRSLVLIIVLIAIFTLGAWIY